MEADQEALGTSNIQFDHDKIFRVSEEDRPKLYRDILYKEATSLLAKYLPEAFPKEPTEIFIGVMSQHIGKFRGVHYIALERDAEFDPMLKILSEALSGMEWFKEQMKLVKELEDERFSLIREKAERGEYDFEEIDQKIDEAQDRIRQMPQPAPKTESKQYDWQKPEELLQGPNQFSTGSWRHVYSLAHELIHQKQAELNPSAFPVLTSPELDNLDLENVDRSRLYSLLVKAHKAYHRKQQESLFSPVIEGMATLGALYVMGRFADDLAEEGEEGAADKIRSVRRTSINMETVGAARKAKAGKTEDYDRYYLEGIRLVRKLGRKYGLENIPKMLSKVDLEACRNIIKDSPEYQQMTDDPSLLPGLQT